MIIPPQLHCITFDCWLVNYHFSCIYIYIIHKSEVVQREEEKKKKKKKKRNVFVCFSIPFQFWYFGGKKSSYFPSFLFVLCYYFCTQSNLPLSIYSFHSLQGKERRAGKIKKRNKKNIHTSSHLCYISFSFFTFLFFYLFLFFTIQNTSINSNPIPIYLYPTLNLDISSSLSSFPRWKFFWAVAIVSPFSFPFFSFIHTQPYFHPHTPI